MAEKNLMPELTYSQLFPVHQPTQAEAKFAEDLFAGSFMLMQNNTQFDCNVLIWKEPTPSSKPVEVAVRAGGSVTYGGQLGYFQVFYAGTNGSAAGVKPAGFAGGYTGKGAVSQAGVVGYVQVLAWDGAVPVNIPQASFSEVNVAGGELEVRNDVGSPLHVVGEMEVTTMPPVLIDSQTPVKVEVTNQSGVASSVDVVSMPPVQVDSMPPVLIDSQTPVKVEVTNQSGVASSVDVVTMPPVLIDSQTPVKVEVTNQAAASSYSGSQAMTTGVAYAIQQTISTAAALVALPNTNAKQIAIRNLHATAVVYIGSSTVSVSTGFPLKPDQTFTFDVVPGSALSIYVASDTSSTKIAVLGVA